MTEQTNENRRYTPGNENMREGHHEETGNNMDNHIPASDASRNDERDLRIKEEKGTERLRSERRSVQEGN